MTQTLSIRAVLPADFDQWLPLWAAYNEFYGRVGSTALADAVTRTTWERFLAKDIPVHALVAVYEGRLVGLAHYLFHHSTSATELSCYMQDLFTDKAMRGRGVARALIEAVYTEAKVAGTHRVYWHTHETNRTAQKLYDRIAHKSGFVVYRHLV